MTNAIAIWNFCWDAAGLSDWINEFADRGFEAISCHPEQFAGESVEYLPPVVKALRSRNLRATVHGNVSMDPQLMETMVHAMGEKLCVFSLDSATRQDSRGTLHDAARIRTALSRLQQLTQGTDISLAVEDFPLDAAAFEYFAADLGTVYEHARTGILIDVGHMHMRMSGAEYFNGMSVAEYFRALPVPLVEVHLHDNNGEEDQHAHFGFGDVPLPEIAAAMRHLEFDGVCTFEIAPRFHGRTPEESKEDAVRSLESWQSLMAEP